MWSLSSFKLEAQEMRINPETMENEKNTGKKMCTDYNFEDVTPAPFFG